MKKDLNIICLDGYVKYKPSLKLQKDYIEKRIKDEIPDTLFLLEHAPTYTIGMNAKGKTSKIPVEKLKNIADVYESIGRGGKMTYHGPGQLVGYLIAKIKENEIDQFINNIENLTIETLKELGVDAYSRKEEKDSDNKFIRGAWAKLNGNHKKLAAQGLELKKVKDYFYTMHGFAININTDLSYFEYIYPCGFEENVAGSAEEILKEMLNMENVKEKVAKNIKEIFNYKTTPAAAYQDLLSA